jgi:hypothetical protein
MNSRSRFSSAAVLLLTAAVSVIRAQTTPRPIPIDGQPVEGIDYRPLPAIYAVATRGEVKESSIEINNRRPQPLEIKGIENPSDRFAARIETLEEGQRYRLTVILKGEGPAGDRRDVLRLKTNLQSNPFLPIPVNTRVREKVYTFPQSVFLGRFDMGEIKEPQAARQKAQMVMVYRKDVPGFDIKVSSDVPFLKVQSQRGPKGDQWENWIWIDQENAKPGDIQGTILIETNDPVTPKLSVPVSGKLLPN